MSKNFNSLSALRRRGLRGVPLEPRLSVRDTQDVAIEGCSMNIWQCDAMGL